MTTAEKKAAEASNKPNAVAEQIAKSELTLEIAAEVLPEGILPSADQVPEGGRLYLENEIIERSRPIIAVLSTDNPLPTLVGNAPLPKHEEEPEQLDLKTETKRLLKQFGLKRAIIEKSTQVVTFDERLIGQLLEKDATAYTEIKA